MEIVWSIADELAALAQQIPSGDFVNRLLAVYQQEFNAANHSPCENDYSKAAATFASGLNRAEIEQLTKAENCGLLLVQGGIRFAFLLGINTAFYQGLLPGKPYFSSQFLLDCENWPDWLCQIQHDFRTETKTLKNMLKTQKRSDKIDDLLYLSASMACAWQSRLYGTMRYAFYLGYRFSLAAPMQPSRGKSGCRKEEIQQIEAELGLSRPEMQCHYGQH